MLFVLFMERYGERYGIRESPADPGRRCGPGGRWCALAMVAVVALLARADCCRAGGGPENLLLVVNPRSAESLAVANAYVDLRGIPPINVFMLPWDGSREKVDLDTFRGQILGPILSTIDSRRLAPQIDAIVYSADFPWRVDFKKNLPEQLASRDKFPSGSLTGMTMLYAAVNSGQPAWLDRASNDYYRPLDAAGLPRETVGFRGWYGWGDNGELLETGGTRYLLSVMLGVTNGRGNTVSEIVRYLSSAAAADGSRPQGTIYYVTNSDVRTKTRSGSFTATVEALDKLGVKAEVVPGTLPERKPDVAGLMTGTPKFDWFASGSTILPGAICENLTSYGGIFKVNAGQTPLSEFLRGGAAGSSGTVIEPYADQSKFPHPSIQLHYARGASLAEAFYQSVHSPYQLLVVGDPLCQPWATIPRVEVVLAGSDEPLTPGERLTGEVELVARGQAAEGVAVDRFELFIDGVRLAQAGGEGRFSFDSREIADGYHELRVVGIADTPLETQGRWRMPVWFANHDRSLEIEASPRQVDRGGRLRVRVRGTGVERTILYATGRVLGRAAGSEATVEIPAELLGRGRVMIHATGRAEPGAAGSVQAVPVTVEVSDD